MVSLHLRLTGQRRRAVEILALVSEQMSIDGVPDESGNGRPDDRVAVMARLDPRVQEIMALAAHSTRHLRFRSDHEPRIGACRRGDAEA